MHCKHASLLHTRLSQTVEHIQEVTAISESERDLVLRLDTSVRRSSELWKQRQARGDALELVTVKLQAAQDENHSLQEELRSAKDSNQFFGQLQHVKGQLETLEQQHSKTIQAMQALRTETQALDSQLQQANAANHVFTDKLSSMATELAVAKRAQLESASQLQAMQSEKAAVQLKLEGSQQSQEQLRQQLASRSSELEASQAAQEAATSSLQTIKIHRAGVQLNLRRSQQVQEELRQQLASRSSELEAARAAQQVSSSLLETTKDEMAAMELRLQIAVSTRDQLAELLQTSTRQLEAAQQAQDPTMAQLQTAQREKNEVEMSMQEVQDDRQQLAESLERTTSQLEALQARSAVNNQIAASWQERNGGEHVTSHEDKQGLPSTSSNPPVSGAPSFRNVVLAFRSLEPANGVKQPSVQSGQAQASTSSAQANGDATHGHHADNTARQRPPTGLSVSRPRVAPDVLAQSQPALTASSSDSSVLEAPPRLLPQFPPPSAASSSGMASLPPGLPLQLPPSAESSSGMALLPPGLPLQPPPSEGSSIDMAALPPGLALQPPPGFGSSSDSGITVRYRTPRGKRAGRKLSNAGNPDNVGKTLRGTPLAIFCNT